VIRFECCARANTTNTSQKTSFPNDVEFPISLEHSDFPPLFQGSLINGSLIMSKFHEKAQAQTKQIIGQLVGDNELVKEGKEQARQAEPKTEPSDQQSRADRDSASQHQASRAR
jgi:uncharacterized protein YjbJ (UPF0337 family)